MPIIDPYKLKRPAPRVESRTFTDPDFPGLEWPLTVRVLSEAPFQLSVQRRAEELIADFVTPEDVGKEKFQPREKVRPVEDENGDLRDILLNEETCQRIAVIQCCEVVADGEQKTDVDTLAEYSVKYNTLFLSAAAWVFGLLNEPRKSADKAAPPKAAGEPDTDGPFGPVLVEATAGSSGSGSTTTGSTPN